MDPPIMHAETQDNAIAPTPAVEPLVELQHISKQYAVGDNDLPVLRDINLTVQAGESLAMMGPSGSGKTTLLNIIGALDEPTSGTVRIAGENISTMTDAQRAVLRNRKVGFVFQLHHLLPQCSAFENVLLPTLAGQQVKSTAPRANASTMEKPQDRARRLLERVGLGQRMQHRPGQLSGGERQRVAFARALINQPLLVLADEPTGSLDRRRADELAQLLLDLNKEENIALIVVTHDPSLAKRMERSLSLHDGQLVDTAETQS